MPSRSSRLPAALALAALAVAAGAIVFRSLGVQSGFGAYEAELLSCQGAADSIAWQRFAVRMPDLQFVEGTAWHEGRPAAELRIGGALAMVNAAGMPARHEYGCLFRRGQLVDAWVQ